MNDIVSLYLPGHVDPCDSYGLIACELLRHLNTLGAYTNIYALGKTQTVNQPADIAVLAARPICPSLGGLLLGYPTCYPAYNGLAQVGPRVAVTMFESSKLPPAWIAPLNGVDAVIVPSQFCAEVFRQCGVTPPIHIVPLGISTAYKPYLRPLREPFTFLAFGDRGLRKGSTTAVEAFCRAFGEDKRYRLIIKRRGIHDPVHLLGDTNIQVINQDMTEQELYELYCSCDCLIAPNYGEGFGLLPREFAATGGISLATGWGGTADDINLWGWPLPYRLVSADWTGYPTLEGQDLGEWAEPDVTGIVQRLRDVAERSEFFLHNAWENAHLVGERYSWRKFVEQVYAIWKGAADGYSNRLQTLTG